MKKIRVKCSCGKNPMRPEPKPLLSYHTIEPKDYQCPRCNNQGYYYTDAPAEYFIICNTDLLDELMELQFNPDITWWEQQKKVISSYYSDIELPRPLNEYQYMLTSPQFRRIKVVHPDSNHSIEIKDDRFVEPKPIHEMKIL